MQAAVSNQQSAAYHPQELPHVRSDFGVTFAGQTAIGQDYQKLLNIPDLTEGSSNTHLIVLSKGSLPSMFDS